MEEKPVDYHIATVQKKDNEAAEEKRGYVAREYTRETLHGGNGVRPRECLEDNAPDSLYNV